MTDYTWNFEIEIYFAFSHILTKNCQSRLYSDLAGNSSGCLPSQRIHLSLEKSWNSNTKSVGPQSVFQYLGDCPLVFLILDPRPLVGKGLIRSLPQLVVSDQFFSKTALRIFLIFCMKVVPHKISKLTRRFFRKNS